MLSEKIITKVLKQKYGIKTKELEDRIATAQKQKKDLEQYIIDENIVDEIELYTEAAKQMKVPFITLKGRDLKKEILTLMFSI